MISSAGILSESALERKEKILSAAYSPAEAGALCNEAVLRIEQGLATAAEELLLDAIAIDPRHIHSLINLATVYEILGNSSKRAHYASKAWELDSANPEARVWHCRILLENHKYQEAEKCLLETLRNHPYHHGANLELAWLYEKSRKINSLIGTLQIWAVSGKSGPGQIRYWEACQTYLKKHETLKIAKEISNKFPWNSKLMCSVAAWLIDTEFESEAADCLVSTTQRDPSNAEAWELAAALLYKQKNFQKAIQCCKKAIQLQHSSHLPFAILAKCHQELGNDQEASDVYQVARSRLPKSHEILADSAVLASKLGDHKTYEENIASMKSLNSLAAELSRLNAEGIVSQWNFRFEEAGDFFRQCVKLVPHEGAYWNNLANAYGQIGKMNAAIYCYRRAINANPNDKGSHVNYAMALFGNGDIKAGLNEYEWRLRKPLELNHPSPGKLTINLLNEKSSSKNKFLVISEQGLGDTVQFIRFLWDARHLHPEARIACAVPKQLKTLIERSARGINIEITEAIDLFEGQVMDRCALMSLPFLMGKTSFSSIAPAEYLKPCTHHTSQITAELAKIDIKKNTLIGLHWRGNVKTENSNLRGRSFNLKDYHPLIEELEECQFVSLQKESHSQEICEDRMGEHFVNRRLGDKYRDELTIESVAALIKQTFCVITNDTMIAHLASALGHPTLVMLSATPDWRWGRNGDKTSWYPKTLLIRQTTSGEWKSCMQAAVSIVKSIQESQHSHQSAPQA
jgi:tetratricopeptide (TPR) repeat protein